MCIACIGHPDVGIGAGRQGGADGPAVAAVIWHCGNGRPYRAPVNAVSQGCVARRQPAGLPGNVKGKAGKPLLLPVGALYQVSIIIKVYWQLSVVKVKVIAGFAYSNQALPCGNGGRHLPAVGAAVGYLINKYPVLAGISTVLKAHQRGGSKHGILPLNTHGLGA